MKEKNPIEALLDPENAENIVLYDENDKPVEFEQIALIPLNNSLYTILKPVEKMDEIADDEAVVFELVEDEDAGDILNIVMEEEIVNQVFDEYKKIIEQSKSHKKSRVSIIPFEAASKCHAKLNCLHINVKKLFVFI